MFKLLLQHNYPNSKIQTNSIWYSWKRIAKCFFKIRRKGNQEYNFMISGPSKARLGYMCPVDGLRQPRPPPGEIARVGGHRRQPVLNIFWFAGITPSYRLTWPCRAKLLLTGRWTHQAHKKQSHFLPSLRGILKNRGPTASSLPWLLTGKKWGEKCQKK